MEALLGFGESLVVLIVGLAARFVLALAVLALLVVPLLIVFQGVKSYRRVPTGCSGSARRGASRGRRGCSTRQATRG